MSMVRGSRFELRVLKCEFKEFLENLLASLFVRVKNCNN